jgi:hypothetical protein
LAEPNPDPCGAWLLGSFILPVEAPGIKPNRRPDIMVVRKDRKIDQYEVPSKTDNVEDLIERMEDNQRLLKDRAGDIFILPPKK